MSEIPLALTHAIGSPTQAKAFWGGTVLLFWASPEDRQKTIKESRISGNIFGLGLVRSGSRVVASLLAKSEHPSETL